MYGVMGLVAEVVRVLVINGEELTVQLVQDLMVNEEAGSTWSSIFALVVVVVRYFALRRARGLVLADRARYDEIWAGFLADAREAERVEALAAAVALVRDAVAGPARHLNRRRGAGEGVFGCGESGTLDEAAPVTSLDQLYFQVRCAGPDLMLREGPVQCVLGSRNGWHESSVERTGPPPSPPPISPCRPGSTRF
jgi:hypothetical protein